MSSDETLDVAVVGAGPYGLSVAAHLSPHAKTRVFGPPMETWRTSMPPDMLLRSEWEHTNLSAPNRAGSLAHWVSETRGPKLDPIPLQSFLDYSSWFIDRFVQGVDDQKVRSIEDHAGGFRIRTNDDRAFWAKSVVIATGVTPFSHVPAVFNALDASSVTLPLDAFGEREVSGKRVVVVGGGQNAMESALRATRAGAASVEVVVRSTVRWFAEREPYQERNRVRAFGYRLAYPITGFGPPPINRLVLHPELFAMLPVPVRQSLNDRLLRPGGSPWLRDQLQGSVAFHEHAEIRRVEQGAGELRLSTADGRTIEADRVIVACGFKFDLARMQFVDDAVKARIKTDRKTGWPQLSAGLESTAKGVRFAGFPAEGQFGPLVRFIEGSRFAAQRCSSSIRASTRLQA